MLTKTLKAEAAGIFELKLRMLINGFILKTDTLEQFETEFNKQVKTTEGYGDLFKVSFYTKRTADMVQVWRRSMSFKPDRFMMEITVITY